MAACCSTSEPWPRLVFAIERVVWQSDLLGVRVRVRGRGRGRARARARVKVRGGSSVC